MSNHQNSGYKISFKGKTSSQEIIEHIAAELLNLQKNMGIEEFSGVNFYCQVYKNNENQTLVSKNNKQNTLTGITIFLNNNHKIIKTINSNEKIISYNKDIDFNNLEKKVNEIINEKAQKNEHEPISTADINAEIKRIEAEHKRILELEKENYKKIQKLRLQKEKEDEKLLEKFKDKIKIDFNIKDEDEFRLKVSSFAIIISEHTIKKYLGPLDKYDERYLRVTLKDIKTQKASDVYVYDTNFDLKKHVKKQ